MAEACEVTAEAGRNRILRQEWAFVARADGREIARSEPFWSSTWVLNDGADERRRLDAFLLGLAADGWRLWGQASVGERGVRWYARLLHRDLPTPPPVHR